MELTFRARLTRLAHLYKALSQQHHREMLPAFVAVLDRSAVVIEAGGHAGQFTKLMARVVTAGRVLSFEPGNYAYDILERVVRWKTAGRAKAIRAALGSSAGSVELHVPIKANGVVRFGLSHVICDIGAEATNPRTSIERVPQTTIDNVVDDEGLTRVDLLKADIEGGELQMLKGAVRTLDRFRPILFLEVDDEHLRAVGDSAPELWSFIEDRSYRGFTFDPVTARFLPARYGDGGDVWFVPPERAARVGAEGTMTSGGNG